MSYSRKTSYQRIAGIICTAALVGGGLLAPTAHYVFMLVSPLYAMSDGGLHPHSRSTEPDSESGGGHESTMRSGDHRADHNRGVSTLEASQRLSDPSDASHQPCEFAALYASAASSIITAVSNGIVTLPAMHTHAGVDASVVENRSLHCFGPRGPPVIIA